VTLPKLLPPPLLAALCLALATSPLAQAQDATSMTLSVGPSKTATPTPAPEKPILEIWAGAPDHQKPVPIPGQTPGTGEPVTPAPKAKRTRVKRHPTLTPLSSAKTVVVSRPLPVYPYQAKHRHIAGDGVCVMTVDTASGKVIDATMKQSSGNAILDKSTTDAFRQWRFKPRTVSRVRVPISYKPALGVIPAQVFADHVVVYENVESR